MSADSTVTFVVPVANGGDLYDRFMQQNGHKLQIVTLL
jgi:hypothetical protein